MDKKKSLLNVSISLISKIVLLILTLLTKRFLIKYCGNDCNGIESLYISIMNILAVAELGVGTAITFCMYKPIIENNDAKVAVYYRLFKKIYWLIDLVMLIIGIVIIPFLKFIMSDYTMNSMVYLTYILMLITSLFSYLYAADRSLIIAYKDNYKATLIITLGTITQRVAQIIVLVITQSFLWYMLARFTIIFILFAFKYLNDKLHRNILSNNDNVSLLPEEKTELKKNVYAIFLHKIGDILVNSVDSLLISTVLGVYILGLYSNYITIMVAMIDLLTLVFTSLTSIIGHAFVKSNSEEMSKKYMHFFSLNFILGFVFFLGYYAVIDDLIEICFGNNLLLDKQVVIVITINYFIQFMRKSCMVFKEAAGLFYKDRYRSLIEGITNLALSIIFVKLIGLPGVIVATIVTNIFICHIVEPYVLYKYGFNKSPKKYYFLNYLYIIIFIGTLYIFSLIEWPYFENNFLSFFVNGFESLIFIFIPCIVILLTDKQFYKKIFNFLRRKV